MGWAIQREKKSSRLAKLIAEDVQKMGNFIYVINKL